LCKRFSDLTVLLDWPSASVFVNRFFSHSFLQQKMDFKLFHLNGLCETNPYLTCVTSMYLTGRCNTGRLWWPLCTYLKHSLCCESFHIFIKKLKSRYLLYKVRLLYRQAYIHMDLNN
jgi:hypothetical protein